MIAVVRGDHVELLRRRHEVRAGRARDPPAVQDVRLHEPALQGQMAVHQLRQGRAAVQGRHTRVPVVVRAVRDAVAERERRRVLGVPARGVQPGQKGLGERPPSLFIRLICLLLNITDE